MNRICKKLLIIFIPLIIGVFFGAYKADAYTDEGIIMWSSGGNIMARTYSEVTGKLSDPFVAIAGTDGKFINVKAAPSKKEFILGVQDTSGNLNIYRSSTGINWTYEWTVSLGDGNVARYDIAYEQTSGRALVVYRGRVSGGKTSFYYRIWNGLSWTNQSEQISTVASFTGNIVAVKLASRPNSNQIGMAYIDDKYYAVAVFWSGTAWAYASSAITTNSTRYDGFSGSFPPMTNASVAFESTSGDMLVVAGQNDSSRMKYITRSAAGSWSSIQTMNKLTGYGDYSRLQPNPNSNDIILTSCMMEPNSTKYLCDFVLWTGTAFGTVVSDSATGQIRDGDVPTDAFWVNNGTNKAAVVIYDNDTTSGLDWYLSINGGNFIAQNPYSDVPSISAHEGQIVSNNVVGFPSEALAVISDENNSVFMKHASFDGTKVIWDSIEDATLPEITQGAYPVTSSNFGRISFALQAAPPLLTISTTSAISTKNIPSGISTYIANNDCTKEDTCSGLVLTARGKASISISKIILTNLGTINLNTTSNWVIGLDNDGNPNNGVTRTVSGYISGNDIIFNLSPELSITNGQRIYIFPKATFGSTSYPTAGDTLKLTVGSIANIEATSNPQLDKYIIGSPFINGVIVPAIDSYDNLTEPELSNTGTDCLGCGARIGPGIFTHIIEINGKGFGENKGEVWIGSSRVSDDNITIWTSSKITISLNTQTAGNHDEDFGVNYGREKSLVVKVNDNISNGLDFYLFPQIISVSTGLSNTSIVAKEYNAADSYGLVYINGTRLGQASSSGVVTILGCSNTTCTNPTDSVITSSWLNTSITARVPIVIPDDMYSGNIVLKRSYPASSTPTTVTYKNPLTIRPRISSITPTSGSPGGDVTIYGDHLCPNSGVCPSGVIGIDTNLSSSPQFSTNDNVMIGGVQANYFNLWDDMKIITKIPSGSIIGSTTLSVTAGSYNAGLEAINIFIVAIPGGVKNIKQFEGGLSGTPISLGGYTSTSTITIAATLSATSSGASQMRMNVEVQPIGSNFVCGSSACTASLKGNWINNSTNYSQVDCSLSANNCAVATSLGSNAYHYRVRSELLIGGNTYYGPWSSYPDGAANLESDPDFWVDSDAPVIIGLTTNPPGTNSVTISWDTNEKTDTLVQINKIGTFTDDCAVSNSCSGASAVLSLSHSVSLKNLSSNTTYYYRVRSRDAAGNVIWSSVQQFKTIAVEKPAKTIFLHTITNGGVLNEGERATSTFILNIPELNPDFKSIFIDLRGNYTTSGLASNASITVKVNSESSFTYSLPGGSGITSPWRVFHKVKALNLSPANNTITITSNTDTTLSSVSGDAIVSYLYTP